MTIIAVFLGALAARLIDPIAIILFLWVGWAVQKQGNLSIWVSAIFGAAGYGMSSKVFGAILGNHVQSNMIETATMVAGAILAVCGHLLRRWLQKRKINR